MDHSVEAARQRELVVQVMSLICSVGVTPKVLRRASASERSTLSGLQAALKDSFSDDDPAHVRLLERLWAAFFADEPHPFQRVSPLWTLMGFQNKDPASDVRGGGRLALESLCYLFEEHRELARRLFHRRAQREQARPNSYANYPFACAGIAITRRLCELFLLVHPLTGKAIDEYEFAEKPYWHVAGSKTTFFELYCCAFSLLDTVWHEQGATYMQFGQVMTMFKERLLNIISRLPAGVVPSARSFNFPTGDPTLDFDQPTDGTRVPSLLSYLTLDQDDRRILAGADECEEEAKQGEDPASALPPAASPAAPEPAFRLSPTAPAPALVVEEDLLGLGFGDEEPATQDKTPTHGHDQTPFPHSPEVDQTPFPHSPEVDFFGSFGLGD